MACERLKALEREVKELRRADENEGLRAQAARTRLRTQERPCPLSDYRSDDRPPRLDLGATGR